MKAIKQNKNEDIAEYAERVENLKEQIDISYGDQRMIELNTTKILPKLIVHCVLTSYKNY